ncbi:trypsin-like peptidase domain-containing protein [Streptomyces sp. NPDC050564]|uniref:trypsin-like peptidase domain-containing protein n=1 Tax=Streptomyces sp. NPDC050564 TaxID=3365631 RepID=UPI00378BF6AF
MNEGKPTKAKWWSRPRPPVSPGDAGVGSSEIADGPGGVAHVRTPGGAVGTGGDVETPGSATSDTGGDFELDRPAPAPTTGGSGAGTDGDFELERPAPVRRASAQGGDTAQADRVPAPGDGGETPVRSIPTQVTESLAQVTQSEASTHPGAASERDLAQVTQDEVSSRPGAASERAKPLHDPDPYGTPPYGQPGPWAPAPPVQHPAATPAHGTHLSAPTPAQGTHVPAGTPAQGTHVPAGTPAQGPHVPAGTPAQGTHVSAGTPAQGTHVPGSAPALGTPFDASPNGTTPVAHAPAGGPPAAYAGTAHEAPVQSPRPPAPWQNYDPWAAPGPLQQNGAAVATVTQRRKRAKKVLVLGAVVLALVSGGVGGAVGAYLERNGGMGDVELPQAGKEAPGRAPDSVAGIAAHALPSVVTLHVRGSQEEGTGTGFVLDGQGHILTNNHVIEPAGSGGEISVTFSGGETAKAKVVGHDSGYDLAVVKVSGVSGLDPMPLGNSDNVQVGDPVVAIGAPFDLANTVTSGIISAKERPITAGGEKGDGSDVSYVDALQTDAPINPGNSGGPLLDSKARVIGINSAIRSADSGSDLESGQAGSIGLGFAIPINQGKRVAEELINTGKATHPVIGVTLDMNYTGDGARVGTKGNGGGPPVTAGGPGAEAGIEAGDVITEVDGQRVHSGEELIVKTRAHRPGDRLQLTLRRGDTQKKVTLVLGSADGD